MRPGQFETPPTSIYLLRHGEVEARYHKCYYGQMDVPLSERGERQSRELAQRLASVPFDVVYASDLARTGYLADRLSEPLGLPVRRLAVFRERNMGILQGLDPESLDPEQRRLFDQWRADRVHFRVPEAENFVDLRERVVPPLLELVAAYAGRRVALVGHAGTIRVMLAEAMGLPLENVFRLSVNLCSVNVVEFPKNGAPRVTLING